jgi:hypothetical protein
MLRAELRDEARDESGEERMGEEMPVGGMKAVTVKLPPSSTSLS